jgi:signal transduction histidine kinase
MNGVLGMAELLSLTDLSLEQIQFVDSISVSAQHLLSIINDVLDYS